MFKLSSTVIFVLTTILVGSAVPQTVGGLPEPPRFEDYPVARIFKGTPAPVDLRSHPQARSFRTRLHAGAKHGPNFAGHLTIVTWGCGTSCRQLAIVDAKTGGVTFGPLYTVEVEFRLASRLLIVNTPESLLEYYGGRCPEGGRSIDTVTIETLQQDMDSMITPPVWVLLAAGPPVRAAGTGRQAARGTRKSTSWCVFPIAILHGMAKS
jgi:hypothetical protein